MAHIKSFGDLDDRPSDPSDDEQDKNDYYAGGKSGQIIRGPPDQDDDEESDRVNALFERAKRAGAAQGTSQDLEQPGTSGAGTFQGQGRRLVGDAQLPVPAAAAPPTTSAGPVVHVITFWRNSVFTVDSGPPRRVDDPANFDFIASISKGECPKELEPAVPGTAMNVNLVRKEEDYAEPEKGKYSAFQGAGQTLGGSMASTSGASAASSTTEWAGVDESKPVTSLQLRLADGSRMVARFNHTHRVADVRSFIRASKPDATFPYVLMSGVPPQPIADEQKTLADAGLLNAVLIQRK